MNVNVSPARIAVRWQSSRLTNAFYQMIWSAGVLLLPITSLPLIIDFTSASTVAPPTPVLFLLLGVVWLFPLILLRGQMPVEVVPFLAFLLVVFISWGASFFLNTPPFRGKSVFSEGIEALVTLAFAAAVYLVTSAWLSRGQDKLRFGLVLLNWGGAILIAWSMVQAVIILFFEGDFSFKMIQFQNMFSSRHDPLFVTRITGFAYEPSWFAHQLNMVYLPVWLAASLTGFTAQRRKLGRLSVENILLVCGVISLYLSFSRVGWISFLAIIAWLFLGFFRKAVNIFSNWLLSRTWIASVIGKGGIKAALLKGLSTFLVFFLFAAFFLSIGIGLLYLGIKIDPRLARIASRDLFAAGSFYHLTNYLEFAERVLYWAAGWNIFNAHPLLGVGLGNAGFYFPQKMPAFGWSLTEVNQLFNYQAIIPNIKSMWVRILAETGLVGISVFAAWYYMLWQSGRLARQAKDQILRVTGLAGQFVLIAFLVEGFSIDSFALPYFWFAVGLLSAAAALTRRSFLEEKKETAETASS